MKIESENFLFETENFIIALETNSVHKLDILITPKNNFKSFSELPFELLYEFEVVIKILTTILSIDDFILLEQFLDNSYAQMHFVKNILNDEQKAELLDVKKRFENKVLVYSLLELWIGRKKKLVRNKIPEIFAGKNKKIKFVEVDDNKYMFFLKRKLVEEVNEVLDALENFEEEHLKEEIADALEVIDAIKSFKNLSHEEILKVKERKKLSEVVFTKK